MKKFITTENVELVQTYQVSGTGALAQSINVSTLTYVDPKGTSHPVFTDENNRQYFEADDPEEEADTTDTGLPKEEPTATEPDEEAEEIAVEHPIVEERVSEETIEEATEEVQTEEFQTDGHLFEAGTETETEDELEPEPGLPVPARRGRPRSVPEDAAE